MRVIVFGAGGAVGGWISEQLAVTPGIEQVGVVRKWASAVRLARRGIALAQADLEHDDIREIVRGADVVVNATMLPSLREAAMVESLFRACSEMQVRRFIQLSSAAIYGNRLGEIDETLPPSPCDEYSAGKAEMEERLLGAADGCAPQVFILRPSIVYGPFSAAWTERYARRIIHGRWKSLGSAADGTCNLVHGRDLARVVVAAATAEVPAGNHILNINGPDAITWNQYIEKFGEALRIPEREALSGIAFRTSAWVASLLRIGRKFQWVRTLRQRSRGAARTAILGAQRMTDLYPDSGERALLRRRAHYSSARVRKLLGVEPSVGTEEGISESGLWCKRHGIV
jgi:nucleoside-diphosphate-sugar epimerase